MDPSSVLHSQGMGIGNNSVDNMLVCSNKSQEEKKPRPQQEEALRCPRCDSLNTKFCYYNNYSLTQPRYFCKSCRRYWTKGGTLRNVPVGGGCRKNNKRPSSSCSSSSSISSKLRAQDHQLMNLTTHQQHLSFNDCNDLTLAFSRLQNTKLGFDHHEHLSFLGSNNHYDHILGNNPNFTNATATTSNFHHVAPNNGNFENMYYGGGPFGNNGNTNMGEVVDNGNGDQMMLPFDNHDQAMLVTTLKQESDQDNNNNKILWGFPWQQMGDNGNNNMGDHLDLGRDSNWNASLAPSWHGLLNSPLM